MKLLSFLIVFASIAGTSFSQSHDEQVIRDIFDNALLSDDSYNNLEYLCEHAPGRLLGSAESVVAVNYLKRYFEELGADTLGPSPSTPGEGLVANVVEVQGLEELKTLDSNTIAGKIVFFNKPVNLKLVNTFQCYGSAIDQRYHGPALAAEMGAAGVLVRSVTTKQDTFPHTGSIGFEERKIPCAAISTIDADILSDALKADNNMQVKEPSAPSCLWMKSFTNRVAMPMLAIPNPLRSGII